jgi:hypothetical protein
MKAVITKSQLDRIKNFINETREIKKEDFIDEKKKSFPDLTGDGKITKADILKGRGIELDEKKKLSKNQLDTFDIDNDGDIEGDDLSDLRAMKKIDEEKYDWDKCFQDALKRYGSKETARKVCGSIRAKSKGFVKEDSDCGCGDSDEHNDTRYMFFSNLEQMMRQAKRLLDMDEDMLEDLLNNGHDWAADHIAEAKNNMDQVFDFIMGEMNGEGEGDDWDNEEDEEEDMMYEGDSLLPNIQLDKQGTYDDAEEFARLGQKKPQNMSASEYIKYLEDKEKTLKLKSRLFQNQPSINEGMSLKKKAFVSKELKNHLDKNIPLSESEFRSGSPKHIELLKEVKELFNKGLIALNETDEFIVNEFDPKPIKVKGIGEVYLGLILEEYESDEQLLSEAVYQGRKVSLGKPFLTPDGPKKRSVYVRNDKGNVVKVNFGDPNMRIKKNIPARRKSFRARHKCSNPGPRHKAKYWSCRAW